MTRIRLRLRFARQCRAERRAYKAPLEGSRGRDQGAGCGMSGEVVERLAEALYVHRDDMVCYDHPESYCCTCGEHEVGGYREHLADALLPIVAAEVADAEQRGAVHSLREAAYDWPEDMTRGEAQNWLTARADHIARAKTCSCGSPDTTSLNPAEVVVHRRDGEPCYIARAG